MLSVFTVANFFIDVANSREDDAMTNLKLNKLLYFAQGCHLARTGKSLFDEQIEAWQLGPVAPAIYQKYKVCGRDPIPFVDEGYDPSKLSADELETLTDVMREYGCYTGNHLVNLTHRPGTPWHQFYDVDERAYGYNSTIPRDAMKEYFTANPVPRFEAEGEVVEKLPNDWYDPAEDDEWEDYQ